MISQNMGNSVWTEMTSFSLEYKAIQNVHDTGSIMRQMTLVSAFVSPFSNKLTQRCYPLQIV